MNLNDIMQAAQGGQGINNIAAQFGLTPEQAQAAVQAAMPAFSQGLQKLGQDPGALGGVLTHIASDVHQGSFTDPSQSTGAGAAAGGDVLGQIFGSSEVTSQISQRVSQASGVSPQIVEGMMPVIASILMGGLSHSMNSQGFGGILGQLANAATQPGGLGSILAGAEGQQSGGLGGILSGVLGGLLGGGGQSDAPAQQPGSLQTGLNSLTNMFEAGVNASPSHQQGINDILGSLSGQFAQGGRS
jgi:hypothetical protein